MQNWMDRFLSKIEFIPFHECWEWSTYKDKDGYGYFSTVENGKKMNRKAHRMSYMLFNGPIVKGLWVLHKCDNPSCVNPKHLFLGTAKDNAIDRDIKGRAYGPNKTHCKNGHKYTLINTYFRPDGTGRDCKLCKKEANRRFYKKHYGKN